MATEEELAKILKGEVSEDELRESFKKAGLNYDVIKKGAEEADYIHKKKGVYEESEPLKKSYKNPDIPRR